MKTHPVAVFPRLVAIVVIAFGSTLFVQAGGKVAAWGENYYGQTVMPSGLSNARAIAAGGGHSLALKANGTAVAWGWNAYGQATPPPELNSVVSIAAGGEVSLALRANGTVVAWGNNSWGQTNVPAGLSRVIAIATGGAHCLALKADGTVAVWSTIPSPYSNTNLPAGLADVTAVAAGSFHSLALRVDGTVVAWGNNSWGQTNIPANLSNVVAVAAGWRHSLALKADGTVAAWGYSPSGQTNVPAGLSEVVAIAAGNSVNLALKADGTLVAWGDGTYGLTNLPPGIANVTAMACGGGHNLALVSDGPPEMLVQPADTGVAYQSNVTLSVTARGFEPLSHRWLFNGTTVVDSARMSGATTASLTISNAQFSDMGNYSVVVSNAFGAVQSSNAMLTVISPPIITQHPTGQTVMAGTNLTLSGAATGTPPLGYQWLLNGAPVAGANAIMLTLSNVQSSQSGSYSLVASNAYGTNESLAALVTVLESPPYILTQPGNQSSLLGGFATFSVAARGSTPMAYQWRFNGAEIPGASNPTLTLSSLGYDDAGFYTVTISNAFGTIVSAKVELSVRQVAVWGSSFLAPTNVPPSATNLVALSAGDSYLLGLKSDGTVAIWAKGPPPYAQAPTNVPAGLNSVSGIAAGGAHGLALKSNGTVVAWGIGKTRLPFPPYPRLPFPPYPVSSPTNVPSGLSNVVAVAAGAEHSLALQADGLVTSWGVYAASSWSGPWISYKAATNVPANVSNVIAIAAGGSQSLALKSDGRVVAWGFSTNVPASLSNVIAIACTDGLNLALRSDGKVAAWIPTLPIIVLPPRVPLNPVATNVPTFLSNVVAIATGGDGIYGMALTSQGTVNVWGSSVPPPPVGLSNVFAITSGSFLAALVGDGAPRMTIQPASQTVAKGATVRLISRAVGVQPLTYQWQRDGVNLPGATSADLIITNAGGKDTGNYRVAIANSLGATTSTGATLAIPFSTNLAAALNATNLVWTTTPTNAPWFAQIRETHDGDVAAQSGHINHNQQSTLQTSVIGPGTLTFWWKVSSEQGYDRLWFSMDYLNWAAWISGETDWQQFIYHIPAGTHTLNWAYAKDGTVSAGQDAGWLDEVVFTPASPLVLSAPRLLVDGSFVFSSIADGRPIHPQNLPFLEIQASTNLHDWITLPNACTLTNGALWIRDSNCTNYPKRFYRVIEH